jgi:hypothetical protein
MTDEITQEDAQRAATQHQQLTSLAGALAPKKTSCSACLVKGVVTAVSYPYMTVQVDGDTMTSIANVRYLEAYSPVVGDTCTMLKQGPDLLAIGRVNTTTASPAVNGWVAPSLGTGITNTADTVRYRVINDNGERKIQLRGKVSVSGSNITLFTMPADLRPLFDLQLLAARDNTQSNVVQLNIASTGGVTIIGVTSGVAGSSGGPTNFRTGVNPSGGYTDSVDVNHTHFSSDGPNPATPSSWTSTINTGFTLHNHQMGAHQHALDRVLHPTSVSLNGVEYFL